MNFTLKTYQELALSALKDYLQDARTIGAKRAFDERERVGIRNPRDYQPLKELEAIPYVCLRLPTGGGKTLLSAHSVKIAADSYLEQDYPLVLWLVPTNTIRNQTLETLKNPNHPNCKILRDAFDGRFRVLDITDFVNLTPDDLRASACVVVGTFATLRVNNTDGRRVYAHNENLEPHFTTIPANSEGMERLEGGQIKYSFANLLSWHRPLVLVDEAHNNTSKLSVEVLQRVRAACVVEFTATPATDSNLLHNVSATELKAEEMIKLPIRLNVHNTWEETVHNAIVERKRLADLAMNDTAYIRPIVLFQAEEKGRDITKEVLLNHLVESERISREKIAVVTGDQKELDGINLFARDCVVDYVITVEALKEGWDCSFAYVFCSVASVYSKKDVEQMLGRVLRMPYAQRRKEPDLNRAYAHVAKTSWQDAVKQLHDSLVDMGFEDTEADSFIEKAQSLALPNGSMNSAYPSALPSTPIELAEAISSSYIAAPEDAAHFTIERTESGASRVVLHGVVPQPALDRLSSALPSEAARKSLEIEARVHNAGVARTLSPAQRGVPFHAPQLCLFVDGELTLAEAETFLDAQGWNLTDYPSDLSEAEFRLTDSGIRWEIDLNAIGKLTEKHIGEAEQYALDLVDTGWTHSQLCSWLERKCRQMDIAQPVLLEFIRLSVVHLLEQRTLPLTALVRWRFVLAKLLIQKISLHRRQAGENGYQHTMFAPQATVETRFDYAFDFKPEGYNPHSLYVGHPYQFQKHYYGVVGELENKGEEYDCAVLLDTHPAIKHWVRNLEAQGVLVALSTWQVLP